MFSHIILWTALCTIAVRILLYTTGIMTQWHCFVASLQEPTTTLINGNMQQTLVNNCHSHHDISMIKANDLVLFQIINKIHVKIWYPGGQKFHICSITAIFIQLEPKRSNRNIGNSNRDPQQCSMHSAEVYHFTITCISGLVCMDGSWC